MNATPRLRSSYPSTPERPQESPAPNGSFSGGGGSRRMLHTLPQASPSSSSTPAPLIPLNVLDAPSQRFYIFAIYIVLLAWRLYDWGRLVEDEAESFWLFIKWVATDGILLYGLPAMRIPWLEWSNPVITGVFLIHALLNGMLMFRIPIPIEAALAAVVKTLYDRELSISENRVKPSNLLYNSSLIMGKQIINVLPEGSVTLNPDRLPFCIDSVQKTAKLPIHLNQTNPVLIELLRLDFETSMNETIHIKTREIQAMKNIAKKMHSKNDPDTWILEYAVKKPGLYRLQRVLEKGHLEVQRRMSDSLVVVCPKAVVKATTRDRCVGELSDLTIEVEGTPPMKIVYSRTINKMDESFHFQSLQPENLVSPLLGSSAAATLVTDQEEDVSWGQSRSIQVRLNESMASSGSWLYSVDEVHDATGNVANFSSRRGEDGERIYPKRSILEHAFTVHKRPLATLEYDSRSPLRVATGESYPLPIKFGPHFGNADDNGYTITWQFSPIDTLTPSGGHGHEVMVEEFTALTPRDKPRIQQPGLYTLRTISNRYCEGEIKEPASCLLINPPKPDLAISSTNIYDKCAGNSIGFLVDMDLTGTPPFTVWYEIIQNQIKTLEHAEIAGSRHQLELKPQTAGHFVCRFTSIDDNVYKGNKLDPRVLTLEQDVKPPASAFFTSSPKEISACIDEAIHFDVGLLGEHPFTLEYELVHEGNRKKKKISGIETDFQRISLDPLSNGGEYSLTLASVQDKTGCKIFLNDEKKIKVRRQRPRASFGLLEGKRTAIMLEGKEVSLPLRLEGESPWTISYRNLNDTTGKPIHKERQHTNDNISISQRGMYEILSVSDRYCPGVIDPSAATFEVNWKERPDIKVPESAGLILDGQRHLKPEVCEGDVDAVEINLSGSPPFHLSYQQRHNPDRRDESIKKKIIDVALGVVTIAMDTSKAGINVYEFSQLSDISYDSDPRKLPLVIQQMVNPKPSAEFQKPGQSYKYCKDEEGGDEIIPIMLHGTPPFYVELDIKHQSSSRPETVKIPNIEANNYGFRIPHAALSLGTHHVSVRKVRDARGCQRKTEYGAPSVQVQVFDVPTIYALESQTEYCVGDRISYTLSGTPPFEVFYTFGGVQRKAKSPITNFRRIAEKPGNFVITAISDKASECKALVNITKAIHEMPSVKISKGRQVSVDIHEGGETQIQFDFWGTPPFEFTYTRSTNARKGHKSVVLETRHDVSYEHSKTIQASQEGTYEVVAIKDKFCAFSTQRVEAKSGQKLLQL